MENAIQDTKTKNNVQKSNKTEQLNSMPFTSLENNPFLSIDAKQDTAIAQSQLITANPFNSSSNQENQNPFFNQDTKGGATNPFTKTSTDSKETVAENQAGEVIQREYALETPNPEAIAPELTEEQIDEAIRFNRRRLRDASEIGMIRDVIGVTEEPREINADFIYALSQFQAENNLTADGKLGAVTSSRLSRELRAEARSLPAGDADRRDLSRYSRRMGTRAMSINVNQAATSLSQRGSANLGVNWIINDRQANGYVIQHVRFQGNITDAAGNAVAGNLPVAPNNEYWEAWRVTNGFVNCGNLAGACAGSDDTFRTGSQPNNTRGTITVTGRVSFFPDYALSGWTVTPCGVHPACDLPHRTSAPAEWNEGETMLHRLEIRYDAVTPAPQVVTSTPS
jgi:hypothetical protein